MREVEEWMGKHDDSRPPARVRERVFLRYGGVCYLSGRKIRPGDNWQLEHIIAICNGGRNIESNLAPALVEPHKAKTRADIALKSRNARIRKRHLGIKKPRTIRSWRKFDGTIVRASRER